MENGKVVESVLEKSMIFDEEMDTRHTEHKFTLPNVREGSIIEFYYKVRSDFWSLPDWQFQHDIPALWSECRVSYPEYFYFKKLTERISEFFSFRRNYKTGKFYTYRNTRIPGLIFRACTTSITRFNYTDQMFPMGTE